MSNARVTGASEAAIRKALLAKGVACPLVLAGNWLSQTIAMNPRLWVAGFFACGPPKVISVTIDWLQSIIGRNQVARKCTGLSTLRVISDRRRLARPFSRAENMAKMTWDVPVSRVPCSHAESSRGRHARDDAAATSCLVVLLWPLLRDRSHASARTGATPVRDRSHAARAFM